MVLLYAAGAFPPFSALPPRFPYRAHARCGQIGRFTAASPFDRGVPGVSARLGGSEGGLRFPARLLGGAAHR